MEKMRKFDELPKAVKKAVRYINQDASYEQLMQVKKIMDAVIHKRLQKIKKGS